MQQGGEGGGRQAGWGLIALFLQYSQTAASFTILFDTLTGRGKVKPFPFIFIFLKYLFYLVLHILHISFVIKLTLQAARAELYHR